MMKIMFKFLAMVLLLLPLAAAAERVKDLATVLGVRDNQLLGYGLVVGLDGTGDQTSPFTLKSTLNMLTQLGVTLPPGTSLEMKNLASVLITANLPPFARPGQTIDITVSSVGNAKSLRGGTLVMSPLKGADGQVYAMAQGNMLIGEAGLSVSGGRGQASHLIVGRIPGGATVERSVPTALGQGDFIMLTLNTADFTTASRLTDAINTDFGGSKAIAMALDGRAIRVRAPQGPERVAFMSRLENLQIEPAHASARVIINARTGSIVMNQQVTLETCSISHGNMTVVVKQETAQDKILKVAKTEDGKPVDTEAVKTAAVVPEIKPEPGNFMMLPRAVTLNEVIRALNAIGATPRDLLAILQAMKASGALRAELEII
jgi:flagellar P-ring protein precursor FlgI